MDASHSVMSGSRGMRWTPPRADGIKVPKVEVAVGGLAAEVVVVGTRAPSR